MLWRTNMAAKLKLFSAMLFYRGSSTVDTLPSGRSLRPSRRRLERLRWSLCSRWDLRRGSAPGPPCPAHRRSKVTAAGRGWRKLTERDSPRWPGWPASLWCWASWWGRTPAEDEDEQLFNKHQSAVSCSRLKTLHLSWSDPSQEHVRLELRSETNTLCSCRPQ